MREGYAELGTVRLHYVEQGEGPLVVLLHGFPEFWYGWRHQIGPLAEAGFRVVAPDMRGYNLSSKPRGRDQYDVAPLAQDVAPTDRGARGDAARTSPATTGAARWPGRRRAFTPRRWSALAILNAPHPRVFIEHLKDPRQLARSWYMGFFQLPYLPELLGKRVFPLGFPVQERARYEEAYAQPGALTAMLNYYRALVTRHAEERGAAHPHRPRSDTRDLGRRATATWAPTLAEPHRADVPNLERVIRLDTSHWVQHEAPDEVAALLVEFFSLT